VQGVALVGSLKAAAQGLAVDGDEFLPEAGAKEAV